MTKFIRSKSYYELYRKSSLKKFSCLSWIGAKKLHFPHTVFFIDRRAARHFEVWSWVASLSNFVNFSHHYSFFFRIFIVWNYFKNWFIQVYVHKSLSYFLRQFLHYADKYKQTFRQKEMGQWAFYYTCPQSFIITFSNGLQLWGL